MRSLLFYALIASQLWFFHSHYDLRPSDGGLVAYARFIRDRTKPDDMIAIMGMEWDPSMAYYAERKAVMFPSTLMDEDAAVDQMSVAWSRPAPNRIGAIVRCPCAWDGHANYEAMFRAMGVHYRGGCEVFIR